MNTLVFTSASADMSLMLAEWAISLRRLAKYTGDALVLDYGLPVRMVTALHAWGIRTVKCVDRGCIVCTRYIDAAPILRKDYASHVAAHFDGDIWFQAPIDALFDIAVQQASGCVFSPDVGWFTQPFHGDTSFAADYAHKIQLIRDRYGGTIQGGLSCGLASNLAHKYEQFSQLISTGALKLEYGADQFAFNWLFQEDADCAKGHLWNCIGVDGVLDNGVWHSRRDGRRDVAIGIHVVGMCRADQARLFRNQHSDQFREELRAVGLYEEGCVTVPSWGLSASGETWAALASVLVMCRRHRGSALAVGVSVPGAVFADVGCTDMVPLQHGHVHYWDQLGLPRRPHIQHPEKVWLSAKAVDVFAHIPLDAAWDLCQRFERNWFDFMLTMLCAIRSLSWGPMWLP
jgi:hypothetical protein